MKKFQLIILLVLATFSASGQKQKLTFKKQTFELHNVTGSVIEFEGKKVLKRALKIKQVKGEKVNGI